MKIGNIIKAFIFSCIMTLLALIIEVTEINNLIISGFENNKKLNNDIIIINIDSKTTNIYGNDYSNYQSLFPTLISNINNNGNPLIIGIDIIFDKTDDSDDLIDSLNGNNIVLSTKIVNVNRKDKTYTVVKSFDELSNNYSNGFINRYSNRRIYINKYSESSFSYLIYQKAFTDIKEYDKDNYLYKNKYKFIEYSFSDVLNDSSIDFSNKIVLIGDNEEFVANQIIALKNEELFIEAPNNIILLIKLIIIFVLAFSLFINNFKKSSLLFLISIILFISITLIAYFIYVELSFVGISIVLLLSYILIMIVKLINHKTIKTFKKYVDDDVVDKVLNNSKKKQDEYKDVCCMFVDIRGFTKITEKLDNEIVKDILTNYLDLVTSIVHKYGGTVDKYIGDCVMSLFNGVKDLDDYSYKACASALEIMNHTNELNTKLYDRYHINVYFGIGINKGVAFVGNIGNVRQDFTAMGDVINTAERIEGIARPKEILISEEIYNELGKRIKTKSKGGITLKGKKKPINLYKLNGLK